ncbi:MAG: tetratricopeptide repeat protein [Fibrobacter sp.]|nr:tetratricopeptide repeat protein [Fibrobacter sp.]
MPCVYKPIVSYVLFLVLVLFTAQSFSDETFDKLIASGKYKEALDYADEKISPSDRDVMVWIKMGQANEALGMTEKALACFLVSWRMNPNDYNALLGAAKVYNKLGQPDNAINMAKKALDLNFTAEASWEYARACIALDRSAEAKKALEKVMQSDSGNAIANRELGNIYYNEKSWVQAIPLLKKIYKSNPDGDLAYKIGKCYVEAGVADSALVYLKIAQQKGTSSDVSIALARAYYGQKNYKSAAVEYDKVAGSEMTAQDFYKFGVSLEKNGENAAALNQFKSAVTRFGSSKDNDALMAREKVGRARLTDRNFSSAIDDFQFIVDADPKGAVVPEIYFLLAETYQGLDNKNKAITSLEKAISLNSRNIEAYARLADLYQKNGMPDKAKQTYETMMNLSPNDPNVYLILGQYNIKSGKFDEALGLLEKSNSLRKSASASEGIAVAAYNLKKNDKARDAAKTAISLDAGSWDARVILAGILMKDKNYQAAQEHLEKIVQKESYDLNYLEQLATCYDQNGNEEKLVETDKKIASLNRKNVDSRLRLARYADKKNDVETALAYYGELSELTPKNPEVYRRLYELSLKKKNTGDVIVYMKKYLELTPNDAEAHRDLGDVLYEQKNFDGALESYRTALKVNPGIKGFHKRYAEIVIAKGQQDEVITTLTGVIKAGEADLGTYTTLGMIFQKKKIFGKAIEMYQKALQMDPANVDAISALASCQAANGDLNAAVISYEQAVMMNSGATEELKELGELYLKLEREEEGLKILKKYLNKKPDDPKAALLVGQNAFEKKQYTDAEKYLALALEGASADQKMMYAEAAFNSGKFKESASTLEELKVDKKIKGLAQRKIFKMLAESYEKQGQDDLAVNAYGSYLSIAGVRDEDAAYKKAFLQEKSNPAAAIKIYEQNIKEYPSDYRNFLRLGLIYSEKKETLQKAVPMLTRVTDLAASVPAVWLELARVYGKMGKDQEELDAYRKYSETDPQNLEANTRIGILLMRKGLVNEALVYLEISNTHQPNDPVVMAMLAKGYIKTNRSSEAIELLNKAKEAKKDDPDIRYQLFELYQKLGQKDKAQEEIKALVALSREPRYLLLYAEALVLQEKYKDAENTIEDILATDAENIDALLLKARMLNAKKKYDEAIEIYKEIAFINPEHPQALYMRAETHLLQSKPQWAETFYKRTLRADPKFALAELGLAKIAKLRKDNVGYREHLEAARKLEPDNEEILEELNKAGK